MCSAHADVRFVPLAGHLGIPPYSFDVFDEYQAFRGSTLLLFESIALTGSRATECYLIFRITAVFPDSSIEFAYCAPHRCPGERRYI